MNWSQEELKNATPGACFVSEMCGGDWLEFINFTMDLNVRVVVIKRRRPLSNDAADGRIIFASIARCEPAEIAHKTGFRATGHQHFLENMEAAEQYVKLKR